MPNVVKDETTRKVYKLIDDVINECALINATNNEWDSENYTPCDLSDGLTDYDHVRFNLENM
jgi:hypothetical protein|tara:strand:+ start:125 stop:310 length:186 start_codon:yes stop_codon:yes gene_type:complete